VVLYTTYTTVLPAGIKCLSQLPKMPAFMDFVLNFNGLNFFYKDFLQKVF
jgi:hypothetical protein